MDQPRWWQVWVVVVIFGSTFPGLKQAVGQAPRPSPIGTTRPATRTEIPTRASVQIQGNGVRSGDEGRTYANVQGVGTNPRFASYAIFEFPIPRGGGKGASSTNPAVTLTLTQSVTRFTRDGKLRLFLMDDAKGDLEALSRSYRFEPARVPDGLGNNLPKLLPAGTFEFLKGGQGDADPIPLALDDAGRKLVADRLAAGGPIRVVVVPDVPHVAATYFGAGAREPESRPRLSIDPAAGKAP